VRFGVRDERVEQAQERVVGGLRERVQLVHELAVRRVHRRDPERELVEAHQAAYHESAAEDAAACVWLQKGRQALYALGEDDAGPYHSPHEHGMVHFHEFWRKALGI
jgi:hypothetical protein